MSTNGVEVEQHGGNAPPCENKRRQHRARRGTGSVRKKGGSYYIRFSAWHPKLKRQVRVEELTKAKSISEARALLNERLGDMSRGITPAAVSKVRLGELYEDVQADYRNRGQRLDILDTRWTHIEDFFGPDALAKTITDTRMQHYIDMRRAAGAAPATVLNEIAVLRRMLKLGYEHRKVAQLPRFPTIKVENARQVYFTDDELDRLVQALPEEIAASRDVGNEWLIPFLVTAYWTGARRNELLRLERRQLDLEAGKITLPPGSTKNKRGRTFYLPPVALEALKTWDEKTRALEREKGIIVRQVFHRYGRGPITEFPLWCLPRCLRSCRDRWPAEDPRLQTERRPSLPKGRSE
jgi:integrase